MTLPSGPFNIQQGKSVNFVVEFLDSNNAPANSTTITMTISYTNLVSSAQTDTIAMTAVGPMFTGTWSSTSAALGLATWTATPSSSTVATAQGQIRVIQRSGGV